MRNPQTKASKLLNDIFALFMQSESEIEIQNNVEYTKEPIEEEQFFFRAILEEMKKDFAKDVQNSVELPRFLAYWNHKSGEYLYTVACCNHENEAYALYSVDVQEDVIRRWPINPRHYSKTNA